ncbi:Uncharacterised protein [Stenotrophomonas maltophilia]|nr:Uncharacterised protein [Stenotrophomonas maltophilia]
MSSHGCAAGTEGLRPPMAPAGPCRGAVPSCAARPRAVTPQPGRGAAGRAGPPDRVRTGSGHPGTARARRIRRPRSRYRPTAKGHGGQATADGTRPCAGAGRASSNGSAALAACCCRRAWGAYGRSAAASAPAQPPRAGSRGRAGRNTGCAAGCADGEGWQPGRSPPGRSTWPGSLPQRPECHRTDACCGLPTGNGRSFPASGPPSSGAGLLRCRYGPSTRVGRARGRPLAGEPGILRNPVRCPCNAAAHPGPSPPSS